MRTSAMATTHSASRRSPAPRSRAAASASAPAYHHGDLRNALIEAGLAAVEEIGARELSLRHVARSVGVSEAAPSRHFDGKEGLLAAMAAHGFRRLAQGRAAIAATSGSPREKARQMMESYVRFAQEHKGLFDLMVGPRILARDAHADLAEASKVSFDLFAEAVCVFAREHGWPEPSMHLVVHAAWSVEHGLASLILGNRLPRPDRPVDTEDLIAFSIALFLSGIERGPRQVEKTRARRD
jgi:AcrR family transcriptional regulator